jgi:hypothetical protein
MASEDTAKLIGVTILLSVGLSFLIAIVYKESVLSNWEANRCRPGVVAFSAVFKPSSDPRSASEFATDNWSYCQKQYVQSAIRVATTEVKDLVNSQSDIVNIVGSTVDGIAKTFTNLWNMCYKAFAMIMERFSTAAKMFRNMMNQMYAMVDRVQGIVFSISMALVSLIMTFIDTVQVTLLVSIIIIGIILLLQILLFYIFAPISGLILTVSTIIMTSVVIATTTIAAAMVANACFTGDTPVFLQSGDTKRIDQIKIGDILGDKGRVTAVHRFKGGQEMYDLHGIRVTGDHLVYVDYTLIPVSEHSEAKKIKATDSNVYCLTTTNRRIPVRSKRGVIIFADWEEIDGDDTDSLERWYRSVWMHLNKSDPPRPPVKVLRSEAGFSPDCVVQRRTLFGTEWVRACSVKLGDTLENDGKILGIVEIDGAEVSWFVDLPTPHGNQIVTCATWVNQYDEWKQPYSFMGPVIRPVKILHFYTERGTVTLGGTWVLRDASDVGMSNLKTLVDDIVLGPDNYSCPI